MTDSDLGMNFTRGEALGEKLAKHYQPSVPLAEWVGRYEETPPEAPVTPAIVEESGRLSGKT